MLVLERRIGQKIFIGKDIVITVVRLDRGKVGLGIEAPPEVSIQREELLSADDPRKQKNTQKNT